MKCNKRSFLVLLSNLSSQLSVCGGRSDVVVVTDLLQVHVQDRLEHLRHEGREGAEEIATGGHHHRSLHVEGHDMVGLFLLRAMEAEEGGVVGK